VITPSLRSYCRKRIIFLLQQTRVLKGWLAHHCNSFEAKGSEIGPRWDGSRNFSVIGLSGRPNSAEKPCFQTRVNYFRQSLRVGSSVGRAVPF
jgi:hypothetical protein